MMPLPPSLRLQSLRLCNFRSYEDVTFEFAPGINLIAGGNARGKTTILEAIHYLICGRSFRTQQSSELIRYGQSYFFLEALFVKNNVEQRLKVSCDATQKKIIYNNTVYPSLSNLLGLLHGAVYTPDDAKLVKGQPAARRQFLDIQIAQVDPLYVHYLSRYNRAMSQRNCLLRAKENETIETWEQEMASAAAYIWQQRHAAVSELETSCHSLYQTLSGEASQLSLAYKGAFKGSLQATGEEYFKTLLKNRAREKILGYTLAGPHKDDLVFALQGQEVRFFGSEGQQRTCVAALRLAEWSRLKSHSGLHPLMLVDDVGISLDGSRKERMMGHLFHLGQVFLTSTESGFYQTTREGDRLITL